MTVRTERNGPVTTVILDRPEVRNAVDGPTAHALAAAFTDFDADPRAHVAVLWGAGGTFCAGADLCSMSNPIDADLAAPAPMGPSRLALGKPVIAAISGHAVAGGLELALWCDLRVVESDAVLGVFCRRWGVPLIDGGTVRLPRLVGFGVAMDLILTGRLVEADEALAIGLATAVVGDSVAHAVALGQTLAEFPQETMLSDRASVYDGWGLTRDDALALEMRYGLAVVEAGRRGAQRFVSGEGRGGH